MPYSQVTSPASSTAGYKAGPPLAFGLPPPPPAVQSIYSFTGRRGWLCSGTVAWEDNLHDLLHIHPTHIAKQSYRLQRSKY